MTEQQQDLFLQSMRIASLNCKAWANEIDAIGVALRGKLISPEMAVAWLDDLGVVAYLPTTEPKQVAA